MPKFTALIETTHQAHVTVEAATLWDAADLIDLMLEPQHLEDLVTDDGWVTAWDPEILQLDEVVDPTHSPVSIEERYAGLGPSFTSQEEEDAFWAGYELAVSEFDAMTRQLGQVETIVDLIEQEEETEDEEAEEESELSPVA